MGRGGVGWGCSRSHQAAATAESMGMGRGGVGWGGDVHVHIKLLQPQNLWGWGGVGWGGDVHVRVHVAFTSSCSNRRIYGDEVGWGGDVLVRVHVAFTSSCCNRRIFGDGEGWGVSVLVVADSVNVHLSSMHVERAWWLVSCTSLCPWHARVVLSSSSSGTPQCEGAEKVRLRWKGVSNLLLSPDGQKWGEKSVRIWWREKNTNEQPKKK